MLLFHRSSNAVLVRACMELGRMAKLLATSKPISYILFERFDADQDAF